MLTTYPVNTVTVNSKHVSQISIVKRDTYNFEVIAETVPNTGLITLGFAASQKEAQKLLQTFIRGLTITTM